MDGQCTKLQRKIAENFNRLSRVHQRYRQTDGTAIAYSEREREFTFAKNRLVLTVRTPYSQTDQVRSMNCRKMTFL